MKSLVYILLVCSSLNTMAQDASVLQESLKFQEELNASFKDPETTPLTSKDLMSFETLEFFPADTAFYVVAEFVRTPFETPFQMPTTTDRKPYYVKYGEVYFKLHGKHYNLNIYQNLELSTKPEYQDYLFIPFTDLTNGETSYSGGRYLDLRIPGDKTLIIDFNQAYNPYCAYNGDYSCPIPPEENHLDLPVTAGVMKFK